MTDSSGSTTRATAARPTRRECRLVCSLGQYRWRPTLRHPWRMVWKYAQTPCPCGRRTNRYKEAEGA